MPGIHAPKVEKADALLCPLLNARCVQGECMMWVRYPRADGVDAENCGFALTPLLLGQVIHEQVRTQAAVEDSRNHAVKGAADVAQSVVALAGVLGGSRAAVAIAALTRRNGTEDDAHARLPKVPGDPGR